MIVPSLRVDRAWLGSVAGFVAGLGLMLLAGCSPAPPGGGNDNDGGGGGADEKPLRIGKIERGSQRVRLT